MFIIMFGGKLPNIKYVDPVDSWYYTTFLQKYRAQPAVKLAGRVNEIISIIPLSSQK